MRTRKALEGIRVIDLSQFEAGTACTETLAWLGADVIKIERPVGGEQGRVSSRERPDRDAMYFILLNANKRSVTLNLAEERGKQLLRDLIGTADVFIENFAPGSIERLGFGPEDVQAINPRIVYARIKGFAPGSPFESFLVYDSVAQAAGGSVSITGESMERTPVKPGPNMADTGSGLHCAIGILAALYDREQTGMGQVVEIAHAGRGHQLLPGRLRAGLPSWPGGKAPGDQEPDDDERAERAVSVQAGRSK